MPQATSIVLADAQATPVNHTFNPVGRDPNGVFYYTDSSQANTVGFWRISVEIKRAAPASAGQSAAGLVDRVKIGLHEPVLETVSNSTVSGIAPAPTVAYISRSYHEFLLPARSTLLDRQSLRKMAANLLANAQMISVVENGDYLW